MESFEKKSDQAESQVDGLEEEGDRVGRSIDEAKSDWQSKQGQVPGMETGSGAREVPAEAEEAGEEFDEPNETSVD